MAGRRNQTLKEASCAIAPAQRSGVPTSGEGALSDFAACFESLRRTGQSECELPHILWPTAALLLMKRSLPGPSMPPNVIVSTIPSDSRESGLSFRLSRDNVGGACGCCHYDVFRRPIGTGRPLDQSIANDDPSRETRGRQWRPGALNRTVSPANGASLTRICHETSAAKRSALKLAEAMHGPIVAGAACLVARRDSRPPLAT
jgi:hypothetical protein